MIVTVVRPYGGQEGKRCRVGTQFWVVKPGGKAKGPDGLQPISYDRFRDLKAKGLVTDKDTDATPAVAKVTTPRKAPAAQRGKDQKELTERQKAARRHKDQNGGRTGKGAARSSSPADQAQKPSGGLLGHRKKRGQRGSDGSPSTTVSKSVPGQTANTQQTGDGGGITDPKSGTGENETPPPFV